jgi:hypothetical protein
MAQLLRHDKDTEQDLILESNSEEVVSSVSDSRHDEDTATAGASREQGFHTYHCLFTLLHEMVQLTVDVHDFLT